MRLAILTAGSSTHTKGIMNFVCEEYRQLKMRETNSFIVYMYMIRIRESWLLRALLKVAKGSAEPLAPDDGEEEFTKDGAIFHNIWLKESLFSFLWRTRVTHKEMSERNYQKVKKYLEGYDYIIAHKTVSHYVGMRLNNENDIPFGAFWHGTELSTTTFASRHNNVRTKHTLEAAHDNFFVSKWLQGIAESLTKKGNNHVIYTGPSDLFYKYTKEKKSFLRKSFGVAEDDVVVVYAGNLIPLKNVMLLPQIFERIKDICPERNFKFWIIGNGIQEGELRLALDKTGVDYTMHGKVPPNRMPDYMNCVDVLLLISKKEGLGLVCMEAMKCGANAFGSMVGGIPEVIGMDRCTRLGDKFVEEISEKIVASIRENSRYGYNEEVFSWKQAVDTLMNCVGA